MNQHDVVKGWLKDAYAMEESISKVLENHVGDAKGVPMVRDRLQQHLDATHRHADLIKGCLDRLGEDASARKTGMADISGMMQGMMIGATDDDLVKDCIQDYTTAHMEIASYQALITAAQDIGDRQTVQACQQILNEEIAMQQWLRDHLPMVTEKYLQHAA